MTSQNPQTFCVLNTRGSQIHAVLSDQQTFYLELHPLYLGSGVIGILHHLYFAKLCLVLSGSVSFSILGYRLLPAVLVTLLLSDFIQCLLGNIGMEVATRLLGLVLGAIGIQ